MRAKVIKDWHWISSAVCLVGMLLFSITGITLNHAASIESDATTQTYHETVPASILATLQTASGQTELPEEFVSWYEANTEHSINAQLQLEWTDFELYAAQPKPGGDAWFSVQFDSGQLVGEVTDRGWIAYFNDLHKARNTGAIWALFIDIFAIASILFTLTGLILLHKYSKGRKSTWPLVLAGFLLPMLAAIGSAHAAQNKLTIDIPRLSVAEYHPPYVAVWLANERHQRVVDVAVWYATGLADQEGEKWLKDLRQWWRRSGRSADLPIDGVSGATRRPRQHAVDISSLTSMLPQLEAGRYYLYIEAARELGGRELLRLPIELPLSTPLSITDTGQHELGQVSLTLEQTP